MNFITMQRWFPYVVGIGIGILSWLAFLLSDRPIGCSTAYARSSGMIEKTFRGRKTTEKAYYREFTPTVDWEWMLVVGIVIGAFISSVSSGQFQLQWVPTKWAEVMGSAFSMRWLVALHPKAGSIGTSVMGGLIFGVGFGLLGYCPGTVAGAVGQGSLDALLGGVAGMLIGTGLFAMSYPVLQKSILRKGSFGTLTLPELVRVNVWAVIVPLAGFLLFILVMLERAGF